MSTSQVIQYVQGDLLKGSISLRINDACTPGKQNPYPIPGGAIIKIYFPGSSSSVIISSAVSVPAEFGGGTEVVIDDAPGGEISFTLVPSKGAGVKPSVKGAAQEIDVVVYDSMSAQLQTFQILPPNGIVCVVRGNA